jgi:hypothetical protein
MMIVLVDAHINEAQDIAQERRYKRHQLFQAVAVRDLHLQDLVMMIAITPSLNASKRPFAICPSRT